MKQNSLQTTLPAEGIFMISDPFLKHKLSRLSRNETKNSPRASPERPKAEESAEKCTESAPRAPRERPGSVFGGSLVPEGLPKGSQSCKKTHRKGDENLTFLEAFSEVFLYAFGDQEGSKIILKSLPEGARGRKLRFFENLAPVYTGASIHHASRSPPTKP